MSVLRLSCSSLSVSEGKPKHLVYVVICKFLSACWLKFMLILSIFSLQYQCHAPKDQEDLAASEVEAGGLDELLVLTSQCITSLLCKIRSFCSLCKFYSFCRSSMECS